MDALFDAIQAKYTANSTLSSALSGGLHRIEAKQDASYPFAVYSMPSDVTEYTFDTEWENMLIQFSIYHDGRSDATVQDCYTKLKTVYDLCTLSISGYTQVVMAREWQNLIREEDVWQYSVRYRVRFYKARS